MIISTPRTRLRCWTQADRDVFAAMHADPEVMHDYGGPISQSESDAKLDRYMAIYQEHGFSRWAVETLQAIFLVMLASCRPAPTIPSVRMFR
jgi:RimJ/RimL family protein N-acetyltransferase